AKYAIDITKKNDDDKETGGENPTTPPTGEGNNGGNPTTPPTGEGNNTGSGQTTTDNQNLKETTTVSENKEE
ncbi:hypothetical protein, partial [Bacillus cereus group sp. BfR-BA-01379]|uniref:hypothetical protein n=1 Tax=Bacillus cereus group sp. BfR-BA-01379 TaxID=2920323 RepID=UPI001F5831CF